MCLLIRFLSIGGQIIMNEQTIILAFLVAAVGATLWLYVLKAKNQDRKSVV